MSSFSTFALCLACARAVGDVEKAQILPTKESVTSLWLTSRKWQIPEARCEGPQFQEGAFARGGRFRGNILVVVSSLSRQTPKHHKEEGLAMPFYASPQILHGVTDSPEVYSMGN